MGWHWLPQSPYDVAAVCIALLLVWREWRDRQPAQSYIYRGRVQPTVPETHPIHGDRPDDELMSWERDQRSVQGDMTPAHRTTDGIDDGGTFEARLSAIQNGEL